MPTSFDSAPLFHPTFGSRPEQIVGRDEEIATFLSGLEKPIGSRERCTLLLGQRGMGKTALLLELADRALEKNFVVSRVTAYKGMTDTILEQIQLNGSRYVEQDKRKEQGVSAGALGFSFGLTFSEATQNQYGFRTKLSLLCDKLAEKGKGVLILIDETRTSEAMREVATTYQELVGDGKNIAMCMAGLPHAISSVLNDHILTFLNRAHKAKLGSIPTTSVLAYYAHAFNKLGIECPDNILERAAIAAKGLPYLMQLIGYYLVQYSQDKRIVTEAAFSRAEKSALMDLDDNVFKPILAPLSDNDLLFLEAMAASADISRTAELQERLGDNGPALQPYRKRLIDAGIIEAPRRGELVFAVPYLADYIRRNSGA